MRTAVACYHAARLWMPKQGKPYNQLAALACLVQDRIGALFWFQRRHARKGCA